MFRAEAPTNRASAKEKLRFFNPSDLVDKTQHAFEGVIADRDLAWARVREAMIEQMVAHGAHLLVILMPYVELLVDYETRGVLPGITALHPCLFVIQLESCAVYQIRQTVACNPLVVASPDQPRYSLWEFLLVRRKCKIIGVARVGAVQLIRQLVELYVEDVRNEVRDYRGTRAALRELILVAGNLGDDGRDLGVQLEVAILEKEAVHPSEIDGRKEVSDVDVEHPSLVTMLVGVRDDGKPFLEAVRKHAGFCSPLQLHFGLNATQKFCESALNNL